MGLFLHAHLHIYTLTIYIYQQLESFPSHTTVTSRHHQSTPNMMYSALQLCLVTLVGQALALPNALTARDNCPKFDDLQTNYTCTEVAGWPCFYCCDHVDADVINNEMAEPYDECHIHA